MLHRIKSLLENAVAAENRTIKIYGDLIDAYDDLFMNVKDVTASGWYRHNFHAEIRAANDRKKSLETIKSHIELVMERDKIKPK